MARTVGSLLMFVHSQVLVDVFVIVSSSHCLVVSSFGGRDSGSACTPLFGLYATACRNSQRETLCSALYLVLQKILVRTFCQRGLTFCDVFRRFEGKRAVFQKKTRSLRSETLPTKVVGKRSYCIGLHICLYD